MDRRHENLLLNCLLFKKIKKCTYGKKFKSVVIYLYFQLLLLILVLFFFFFFLIYFFMKLFIHVINAFIC